MRTIETPLTPSIDEHGIVATFSESSLDQLTAVQDELIQHLGDTIWLTPQRALHSTLMEIICDRDYSPASRMRVFADWFGAHNQDVLDVLSEIESFEITFTELEVSQRAIIVRLSESHQFNDIRAKLLSRVSLPSGTKLPPDITHCSLARFNSSIDLDNARQRLQHITVDITETISGFKLLKDLGPPTFTPKLVQDYPLSANSRR